MFFFFLLVLLTCKTSHKYHASPKIICNPNLSLNEFIAQKKKYIYIYTFTVDMLKNSYTTAGP